MRLPGLLDCCACPTAAGTRSPAVGDQRTCRKLLQTAGHQEITMSPRVRGITVTTHEKRDALCRPHLAVGRRRLGAGAQASGKFRDFGSIRVFPRVWTINLGYMGRCILFSGDNLLSSATLDLKSASAISRLLRALTLTRPL